MSTNNNKVVGITPTTSKSTTNNSNKNINSTTTTPTSPTKQDSFLYWKQKDNNMSDSNISSPSSSPTLVGTIGKSKSGFISSPTSIPSPSTTKKSGSSITLSTPSSSSSSSNTINSSTKSSHSSDFGQKTSVSSPSKQSAVPSNSSSQTLPSLRMKPERKSIKTIFMDLWSKPAQEEANDQIEDQIDHQQQQPTNTTTTTSTQTTTTINNVQENNTSNNDKLQSVTPPPTQPTLAKSKSTPTKSIPSLSSTTTPASPQPTSILKSSSKSSPSLHSQQAPPRKSSITKTVGATTPITNMSTTPPSTSSISNTPKKVSPSTTPPSPSPRSTSSQSITEQKVFITSSSSSSSNEENNKFKKKDYIVKTEVERLSNLEFLATSMKKQMDDLNAKLMVETTLRKELETHCNELEARLNVSESRLKRYSDLLVQQPQPQQQPTLPPQISLDGAEKTPIQKELERQEERELREVQQLKEMRDDQRVNTLVLQIKTLEEKVHVLESSNAKLCEEIHTIAFEHSIFTSEKKKKALKKIEQKEKELQKEREQREKELQKEREQKEKELQKEKIKTLKRDKEKEKEKDSSSVVGKERSLTGSVDSSLTDSGTENNDEKKSSMKKRLGESVSANDLGTQSPKKVAFTEDTSAHPNKSKSQGYGNSIKKWAGKRMSAHLMGGVNEQPSSTITSNNNNGGNELVEKLDKTKSMEEKSQMVKGFFNNLYDGDVEDLKNQKMTRMRSKSLSRDSTNGDDDEDFSPRITISSSNSNVSGSLSLSSSGGSTKEKEKEKESSQTPQDDKKKGYSTIGRMFGKKDNTQVNKLTLSPVDPDGKITLLLSERLNHRASRDELIFKKIMKAESIFGIALNEDTLERIQRYLTNSTDVLIEYNNHEDLFTRQVEEGQIKSFKDSIEQSVLSNFMRKDPFLVASTLLLFFDTMPERLLAKISSPIISTVSIDDSIHRRSLVRSLLFSLPPSHRSVLKTIIQLIRDVSNLVYEIPEQTEETATTEDSDPSSLSIDDFSPIGSSVNNSPVLTSGVFTPATAGYPLEEIEDQVEEEDYQISQPKTKKIPPPLPPRPPLGVPVRSIRNPAKSKLTIQSLAQTFAPVLLTILPPAMTEKACKAVVQLVEDFDSHFDGLIDIQFIIKDTVSLVKCASFDKVFERLIDLNNRDTDYNYTIFYTYDYYSKSNDFLDKIVYYYRKTTPTTPPQAPWQIELSLTVLTVAMFWMKLHHNHLSSDLLFLSKLKAFMESCQPVPLNQSTFFGYFKTFFQSSAPIKTLYERGNSFYSGQTKKALTLNADKLNADGNVDIYDIGSAGIATQITLIDNELLMSIPLFQFLHKAFTKPDLSTQFQTMVTKFNEWAKWTSKEILTKEKLGDRVNAMSFFIDLAKSCVEMGNYNAAAAIVGGLNHSSISRLRHTWDKLSTKVAQDYKQLEVLYDMSMNYKNYREALKATKEAKVKVIPYLALFPKDLIAVEEANDTYTSSGQINIEKFRLLYRTIKEIQTYQQPLFNTPVSEPIKNYLLNLKNNLLDEKELHNLSLKVEPRQMNQSSN